MKRNNSTPSFYKQIICFGVGQTSLIAMSTYTILTTGGVTGSVLQTTLRNNNGSAKVFHAFIKDAAIEKEVEVYPCKEDYSGFTADPFVCQLPPSRQSAGDLQDGDVLDDEF